MKIENITFSDTITVRDYRHGNEIVRRDSIDERKFKVTYHLKNTSGNTIRFLYNQNPTFRVYQEDKVVAAFLTDELEHDTAKYYLGAPPEQEENAVDIGSIPWPTEETLRNSMFTLSPGQEWQFTQIFYWNKNQPNRQKNQQGYVDPGFRHYLVLSAQLGSKYPYKPILSEADFNTIKNDTNFIEGAFTSGKAPINFD